MKPVPALFASLAGTALVMGLAWVISPDALTIGGVAAPLVLGALALVIQWVAFVPAFALKSDAFFDLLGSLTFLSLVGLSLWIAHDHGQLTTRRLVSAALVAVWAGRLGLYLFRRVRQVGHDVRFDEIKQNGPQFLMTWTLQGAWAFVTSLAVIVFLTADGEASPLGFWDVLGWGLWGLGFTIEVVADRQKAAFRARNAAPRKWIDEGLWAHAQHPNYFGEILLWFGLFVAGIGVYDGAQWVAVVSPLFVIALLTQVSGIPMLKAVGKARWGDDPEYRAYLSRTRLLVPLPSRRKSES